MTALYQSISTHCQCWYQTCLMPAASPTGWSEMTGCGDHQEHDYEHLTTVTEVLMSDQRTEQHTTHSDIYKWHICKSCYNGLNKSLHKLCKAATDAIAVLDKDHFPILHLESGMAYRLRSDNLLHWTALSATWKLITLLANSWPPSDCLQRLWFDMYSLLSKQRAIQIVMYVCMYVSTEKL